MRITYHFKDRLEERLPTALMHYTPTQIAVAYYQATEEVTLVGGNTYRVTQLDGIEFGLGYKHDQELVITTFIAPHNIEIGRRPSFNCIRKDLTK